MQMYDRDNKHQQWLLDNNYIVNAHNSHDVLEIRGLNYSNGALLRSHHIHRHSINQRFSAQ